MKYDPKPYVHTSNFGPPPLPAIYNFYPGNFSFNNNLKDGNVAG